MLARERITNAGLIGNLSPGGHGALAGGLFGQALTGGDPRLKQAQALEEISQELSSMGLNPGDPEFTKQLVPRVRARLGIGQALEAHKMALKAESDQNSVRAIREGPGAAVRSLMRLGFPEAQAVDLSQDLELSRDVIKARLKPPQMDALVRQAQFALPDNLEGQRKIVADVLTAKAQGQSVTVNNFASQALGSNAAKWRNLDGTPVNPILTPAQASAQGARPITAAEDAAEKKAATLAQAQKTEATEVENSARSLLEVVEKMGVGSVLSFSDRNAYDRRIGRLAKAVAQLRNPGDAEAAGEATARIIEAMPSATIAAFNPALAKEAIDEVLSEAKQATGATTPAPDRPPIPRKPLPPPGAMTTQEIEAELRALGGG
jgi:hypothetical protein